MKKFFSIFLLIILLLISTSFAYETDYYTIDFPNSYHYAAEGSYSNQDGYNINVNVIPYTNTVYYEDVYNDEEVKNVKNNISYIVDNMRNEVVNGVKQRYPGMYTDEQLQYIADSIKLGTIYDVKITKISKNNYDSIMSLYSYYMLDTEYFVLSHSIADKNNVYTLTLSGNSKAYFEKNDIKNAVDSFTIKNYRPIGSRNAITQTDTFKDTNNNIFLQLLFSLVCTIFCYMLFPIIRILINKGKFDEEKAKKIALWNSIIVGGIFLVLTADAGVQWSAGPAFLYYYINKAVLTKKKDSTMGDEEKEIDINENINDLKDTNDKHMENTSNGKINIPWELEAESNENGIIEENIVLQEEKTDVQNEEANVSTELERIELLKKYKELLDSGIITEEDFNKKKENLLK